MTFGEKRKVCTFNLDNEQERKLYEFANSVKFGPLVKRYLMAELSKQENKIEVPVEG